MRKSAFTLVELLVVVAIIALLIAILLPALNKARTVARVVTCSLNLRQLGMGMNVYATDHRGALPYSIKAGGNTEPLNRANWFDRLGQVSNAGGYASDADRAAAEGYGAVPLDRDQTAGSVWHCPLVDSDLTFFDQQTHGALPWMSYSMNFRARALYKLGVGWMEDWQGKVFPPVRVSQTNGSNTVLLGDARMHRNGALGFAAFMTRSVIAHEWSPNSGEYNWHSHLLPWPASVYFTGPGEPTPAHGGVSNLVFADGHTEGIQIWQPSNMASKFGRFPGAMPNYLQDP